MQQPVQHAAEEGDEPHVAEGLPRAQRRDQEPAAETATASPWKG